MFTGKASADPSRSGCRQGRRHGAAFRVHRAAHGAGHGAGVRAGRDSGHARLVRCRHPGGVHRAGVTVVRTAEHHVRPARKVAARRAARLLGRTVGGGRRTDRRRCQEASRRAGPNVDLETVRRRRRDDGDRCTGSIRRVGRPRTAELRSSRRQGDGAWPGLPVDARGSPIARRGAGRGRRERLPSNVLAVQRRVRCLRRRSSQVRAMLPHIIVVLAADYWTTQNCWASVPLQRQVCS